MSTMFTELEAEALIALPKTTGNLQDFVRLDAGKTRLKINPTVGTDFSFILDITLNQKISFKISMHHQEDTNNIGLLRVDFNGTHKNPEEIIPKLPVEFHAYAGKIFSPDDHHIHIYTCPDEYPILSWAIPLVDHSFPIKQIKNNADIQNALKFFAKEINLQSELLIHPQMRII
jgi:hypothetical protein